MADDDVHGYDWTAAAEPWSPIEGVTVDRYAELTREMANDGVVGPEAIEHWLSGRGIDPASWRRITAGWARRMVRDATVRQRFEDRTSM